MIDDPKPPASQPTFAGKWRRLAAILASIGLHVLIIAIGLFAGWIQLVLSTNAFAGDAPLLLVSVGLLMAHCSLGAIWWTISPWPSHLKTLVAACACAITWAMLVLLLSRTEFRSIESAGWAISMGLQAVAAGLLTAVIDIAIRRHRGEPGGSNRFTLLFLLVWMAVIAVLLGVGRIAARQFGWTTEVVAWTYFYQLQVVGFLNAVLAACIYAALASRTAWRPQLLVALVLSLFMTFTVPFILQTIFKGGVGATFSDIVWLYGSQSAFLLATLGPLRVVGLFPRQASYFSSPRGNNSGP